MFRFRELLLWSAVLCGLAFSSASLHAQLEDVSVDHLLDVSTAASWFGCGLSTADFDRDGWDDVTAATSAGPVELYRGSPDGLIHHETINQAAESKGLLWVDVDDDGDLDLMVGVFGEGLYLYIQMDDGSLVEDGFNRGIPLRPGWDVRGISAVDYDNDLDLDLFVASYHDAADSLSYENLMLRNEGAGYFTDQTDATGVGNGLQHSFQGAWFDYDGDGDQDLWVINDRTVFPNALFRNAGGVFYDISNDVGANVAVDAMSATLCDPDNDGDWDMYVTNTENNPNVYQRNSDGVFTDYAEFAGVASTQYGWGTLAIDLNGDMWQDFMVATYRFPNSNPHDNHLYMNQGSGTSFVDEIENWPNEQYQLYCLGQLDLNNDRSPDIIGHGNAFHAQVLENTNSEDASRLTIDLVGTTSNMCAIGALVQVWSGGVGQMRQVSAGSDYMTQHTYTQFFGLGNHYWVDSIRVNWPSGLEETWYNVAANSAQTFVEGSTQTSLLAIEGECPWFPDRWVIPFGVANAEVTWNGVPFTGDTLVADYSGTQVFEVSWWGGEATWTAEVEAEFDPLPDLNLTGLAPLCQGELGALVWDVPDAEFILWEGDTLPSVGHLDSVPVGEYGFEAQITEGCMLFATANIIEPDSLVIDAVVDHPNCFGETGFVTLSADGGTGSLVLDFGSLVLHEAVSGWHQIMVSDSLGCQLIDSVLVVEPDTLISSVSLDYLGISDSVNVGLSVEGGSPPYSVIWAGEIDSQGWTLAPVYLGWLVEDVNGCLDLGVVEVLDNPLAAVPDGGLQDWFCIRNGMEIRLETIGQGRLLVEAWSMDGRLVDRWKLGRGSVVLNTGTLSPLVIRVQSEESGDWQAWLR